MAEIRYFHSGETIPGFGIVETMTNTGYLLVDGGFAPYAKVHPRPAATPLVVFGQEVAR